MKQQRRSSLFLAAYALVSACADDHDGSIVQDTSHATADASVSDAASAFDASNSRLDASASLDAALDAAGSADAGTARFDNPLSSIGQLAAERQAIEIVAFPQVQQARATLKAAWLASAAAVGGQPEESNATLEDSLDEALFAAALSITNTDPNYPKVVSTLSAAHRWYGIDAPGSRVTFDNPDTTYRTIPVDPAARYVIKGHRHERSPIDVNISLWDAQNATIANLTESELHPDANGDYTITVDSDPGDGTTPHLQLTAAAAQVFVRNTIDDWDAQFDSLSVERVAGPTIAQPERTTAQLADALAARIAGLTGPFHYYNQLAYTPAVNTLPAVTLGGANGRLATQAGTYSAFKIADDEALVLTVQLGGAAYFVAPVYNRWMITTDYVQHTQTLNLAQSVANPDGSYTYVISIRDPKVANWVDTVGIHEGFINLRWQALPSVPAAIPPAANLELVKLADLGSVLPSGTKYVTPAERADQLAARAASYAPRYADH